MRDPVIAYVGLGANLGESAASVRAALAALGTLPETQVLLYSSLYRSAPVDAGGPDFINAVAQLRTHLTAPALLSALQSVETAAGRQRPYPNAPRTLDLDVLFYGDARIDSPSLTVPHPRLWQRAFVLVPLHQIAPLQVAPERLAAVADQRIQRLNA